GRVRPAAAARGARAGDAGHAVRAEPARAFVEAPPPFEYGPGDAVRRVSAQGCVSVRGRPRRLGKAFAGERVAVRPTTADGVFGVYYCHEHVTDLDVRGDGGRAAG
ncbi:MAG TPA: hypothetical protein VEA69_23045, partial [Tepidisphaeraceae bacterium]|nr:hypothetical protein [Tepidisphaeraceae bacterium]